MDDYLKFEVLQNLTALCAAKGMEHVIISPGSRSAPLTVSFARQAGITCRVVFDERAAGYVALGLAQQTKQPVGLVCTSGTAALNYGPAVAEAFYQRVPLVVFTADRPPEWIGQDDNQAINQTNLYGPNCRGSFTLPVDYHHPDARWHAERLITTAFNKALWPVAGPVHLNVPLREPLYLPPETILTRIPPSTKIDLAPTEPTLTASAYQLLSEEWRHAKRKLIIVGLHPPDEQLATALQTLQRDSRVAVIADITANLSAKVAPWQQADMILSSKQVDTLAQLAPDLVISGGGPVVSKSLKRFLRHHKPAHHWRVDPTAAVIDTYQTVTDILPTTPRTFFKELAMLTTTKSITEQMMTSSTYRLHWQTLNQQAEMALADFLEAAPFGEFGAVYTVLQALPPDSSLQLGNSMPIRYVNYIGRHLPHLNGVTINANRGTSGIDGCVSTTVGATLADHKLTTLICGDLTFFYDRNALWQKELPANLRIVILNNGGGGIFKLIDGPPNLPPPELETYFFTPQPLTAKNTAADHQCAYFYCDTAEDLHRCLPEFFAPANQAKILEIKTDSGVNTAIFQRFKTILATLNLSSPG